MTYKQIATKLRLNRETVRTTVLKFEERGYDFGKLRQKRPQFKSFTPRITRHLLSRSLLEHWSAYSIDERAEIIRQVWGAKTN